MPLCIMFYSFLAHEESCSVFPSHSSPPTVLLYHCFGYHFITFLFCFSAVLSATFQLFAPPDYVFKKTFLL